ncbi:hypothetical protein KI688_003125 [Linnemannia hyalina]|uniref:Uncharacterized protein n=1 Tax=Linnemannia hyalina TaxID=64524 RepID=A0A9P7XPU2_9FUNG|nr:hypothetical protein KI688_003125 [Linnemannia hyalina]
MEPSASARLFGIPELASIVGSHLKKKDISPLMMTSRRMHEAMAPIFYKNLITTYDSSRGTNLQESPDGLNALARNIHYVKSWSSSLLFFVYYYHATTAYYDSNNTNSTTATATISSLVTLPTETIPGTPQQFSSKTLDLVQLVPLPAMTRLTKLKLTFSLGLFELRCPYNLPNYNNPQTSAIRLCGLLQLLPQLCDLSLCTLSVRNSWSAQLITSALLGMTNLKQLRITLAGKVRYPGIITLLFFSCPPSIERLHIGFAHPREFEIFDDSDMGTGEVEQDAERLFSRRTSPLINIRELTLVRWTDRTTTEEFLSIFRQCPGLEKLDIIFSVVPAGVDGADIGRICPNLRDIVYLGPDDDPGGKEMWPLKVMEVLPEAQIETLAFSWTLNRQVEGTVVRTTILRHSHSLRKIRITAHITSSAIRMIPETCGVLEAIHILRSTIDLSDAAGSPWASSKIIRLSLSVAVTMPSLSLPADIQYIPSYLKTPPTPLSQDEEHIFTQLEVFYRQIGKQTNMEALRLDRPANNKPIARNLAGEKVPFPGLLSLKGNVAGRPGYLDLLGGLSQLKNVGKGVVPETWDYKMAECAPEVDWILEHWPRLSFDVCSFFPRSRVPPHRVHIPSHYAVYVV